MARLKEILEKFENGTVEFEDCNNYDDPRLRSVLLNGYAKLKGSGVTPVPDPDPDPDPGPTLFKSVIFDVADNYGNGSFVGVRSVDFFNDGSLIDMTLSDFAAYSTTELSGSFVVENAFETALSKLSGATNRAFVADETNSERFIIVFNTAQEFDQIIVNNYHSNGSSTNIGINNMVVTGSTDEITDTTYQGAISNGTELFNGALNEHVSSNQVDDQVIYTST